MMRPEGLEQGSVDIGGGTQLYWEAVGSGRPILFVHGLWASSRFFRRQLEVVGRHYRAIALDLRGHGRSSMTPGGHTVPTMARDLRAFIVALGLERPVLVGWSMGAFIAWDYHLQFGSEDVAGLVVVDQAATDFRYPGCEDALVGLADVHGWAARTLTDRNAHMRDVLPMMFHRQPDEATADWMINEMCSAPEACAASIFVDQCLRDYRSMIPDYDVPTLVCSGEKSAQPMSGAHYLRDTLPHAQFLLFEDCGHCLFWEDADRFNDALLAFVGALS